ncbi:MAG: CopD family protein [candidate division NC10 bacterium]|nr:CopD family protein [candidate division NC10 bacterium]
MTSLRLANLWLHLFAASIWIGVSAFLTMLWLPQVRKGIDPVSWEELLLRLGRRYIRWAWLAVHILVLTGIFNLLSVGIDTGFAFPPAFLRRLIAKLVIVLLMVALQVGLSVIWLPRLARGPSGGVAEKAIRRALLATSIAGALALWFALMLRS